MVAFVERDLASFAAAAHPTLLVLLANILVTRLANEPLIINKTFVFHFLFIPFSARTLAAACDLSGD
jgi:hypothetical protein